MKNKKFLVLVMFLIIGLGIYFYGQSRNGQNNPESVEENGTQTATGSLPANENGRYKKYSESEYGEAINKKRVIFFHASWCPTCKIANDEFMSQSDRIPEDVVLFKTDYDTEIDLKKKYGITYQHTFVLVDEEGNEIRKWNGGGVEELIDNT